MHFSYDKKLPSGEIIRVKKPRQGYLRANITYECDLKCPNCNRACDMAISSPKENMTIEQFKEVLDDAKKLNIKIWNKILLTGGEPSKHPDLFKFCEELVKFKKDFHHNVSLFLCTYQPSNTKCMVEEIFKTFPEIELQGVQKTQKRKHKIATYMAPIDLSEKEPPFYRGCHHGAGLCGQTVDYKGFYPCPTAPAIARTFDIDCAVKKLKDVSLHSLTDCYDSVCKFCGYYNMTRARGSEVKMSKSWQDAIQKYNKKN